MDHRMHSESELTIAMLRAKNAGITGSENEDLPRIAPLTSRVIAMLHTGSPAHCWRTPDR